MLIYQQNRNILPLPRETLKSALNRTIVGFAVYYKEVLLRVRWVCDVAYACEENAGYGVLIAYYGEEFSVFVCGGWESHVLV